MIRISVKNISTVCILSSIFFFIVSCSSAEKTSLDSSAEFNNFISKCKLMNVEEFVLYWNTEEYKSYKFSLYSQVDPFSQISWPDNSSAENIFNSKIINCYRICIILKEIYPGEIIYISQPTSNVDHCYYKLSTGKIINNYNDGKYLYLL